jgi:hypothetical protein
MLASLESTVRARGHRRAAAIGLAALSPALVIAAVLGLRPLASPAPRSPAPQPPVVEAIPAPLPAVDTQRGALAHATEPRLPAGRLVGYVTNDSSAATRYAVESAPVSVEVIDDGQLLDVLRDVGMPAGIVRTHERVALAFRQGPGDHVTQ